MRRRQVLRLTVWIYTGKDGASQDGRRKEFWQCLQSKSEKENMAIIGESPRVVGPGVERR